MHDPINRGKCDCRERHRRAVHGKHCWPLRRNRRAVFASGDQEVTPSDVAGRWEDRRSGVFMPNSCCEAATCEGVCGVRVWRTTRVAPMARLPSCFAPSCLDLTRRLFAVAVAAESARPEAAADNSASGLVCPGELSRGGHPAHRGL